MKVCFISKKENCGMKLSTIVSGKIYEIYINLSVNFIQKDFNVLQYFNDYVKNEKNFGLWSARKFIK